MRPDERNETLRVFYNTMVSPDHRLDGKDMECATITFEIEQIFNMSTFISVHSMLWLIREFLTSRVPFKF